MGGALILLVPQAVNGVMGWFPPPPPIAVIPGTARAQLLPDGTWRVERTVAIAESCGSVTYRRVFRGTINGEAVGDLLVKALDSSRPAALDAIVPGHGRGPGTYTDWWRYRIPEGFVGSYIVTVAATDCPSGYSELFTLYVVSVP